MSNRRRKNKHKRGASVKRRLQGKYPSGPAGKASNFIRHVDVLRGEQPHLKAVLTARVSERFQDHKGNLDGQLSRLRKFAHENGITIVGEYKWVGSGSWKEPGDREAAADLAIPQGAVLLAESTDRFIRSVYFNTKENPSVQPTDAEYQDLRNATKGVILATVLHPDTHWKEVRSYQTKRGQQTKGNKGGRLKKKPRPGYKKERRLEQLPHVLRLRSKGASWGDISALTGVAKGTAADWVKRYG
ncbi:MAG: recombinase family protein [Phycisphaerae bacterium]|nr:recombinase family protein [Phycisphaerae bacterium]